MIKSKIKSSNILLDGDLLYYNYPNGVTMIIGYDSKFNDKNISLDSLNETYLLDKVVRNGEIIWKRGTNNTSSRQEDKKFNKNLHN